MAILGTVVALNGEATVIDEKGVRKALHLGDVVQPGDTIITARGVVVELEMVNGRKIQVVSEQTVKFTQELADAIPPDTADNSVDQATIQAVIKAIAEGKDLSEVLEETAAGLGAGGGNSYGFSFVDLLRITEGVTPLGFEFDGTSRNVLDIENPVFQQTTNTTGTGPGNNAPVAQDIAIGNTEGSPAVNGNLPATDVDGDTLTYAAIGALPPGLTLNPDGSFTFDYSDPAYDVLQVGGTQVISVPFTVNDGKGGTDTATLTITITGTNDDPVATATVVTGQEDAPFIPVTLTGTDVDGTVNFVTVTTLPPASQGVLYLEDGVTPVLAGVPLTPAQATGLHFVPAPDFNGNVTIPFTVTDNLGAVSTPSTATITVNPVVDPVISINDITVDEAAGTATFTVTLDQSTTVPVSVNFNTSNGSAIAGADYTGTTGTLTFLPGQTTQTIVVQINNDGTYEGPETFNVNLTAPVNATIGDNLGLGTIVDDGTVPGGDDDRPAVGAVSSPSVVEGGNLDFTVTLTHDSTTPTIVTLTPASGTADLGTDTAPLQVSFDGGTTFVPVVGNVVTVPANNTDFIVRVPTVVDTTDEPDETITLGASTPINTAPVVGTGTILDDDGAPQISITGPGSVNEAAGTITYTVSLTNPSASTVTVNYASANGSATAGSDYTAATGTLSFAPGETTKTITVAITDDTVFEGPEDYSLNLSAPTNATIGTGSVTTTITDNDLPPTITAVEPGAPGVGDDAVPEGTNLVYNVTLSNPSSTPVTYNFTLGGGLSTAGAGDIGAPVFSAGVTNNGDGTITVAPGVTGFSVTVPTTQDTIDEFDETVELTVGGVTGTGTITDDDAAPTISITGPATIDEAAGTATYTVTLSSPSGKIVTVDYSTSNGTATAGSDYTDTNGTLTFNPGTTTLTFTVPISEDLITEASEDFTVSLVAPTNATIATGSVTTNIIDNEGIPTIANIVGDTQTEGTALTYTVTLSNPSATPVTYAFTVGGGTSTASATDIGTPTFGTGVTDNGDGTITVAPGVTGFTVTVPSTQDLVAESNETVELTIGTATGTGTIVDDDSAPQISITGPGSVNEAAGTITYTVSLTNPSASTVTVNYASANGSATAGSDYTAATGTLSFAPGETTKTITVAITDDTVFEGPEDYSLNLSAPTNATIGTGSVTTTINDDGTGDPNGNPPTDDRPQVASVSSPSIAEGGNLDFVVTLSNASTTPTTVALIPASGTATVGSDTTTPIEVSFDGGTNFTVLVGGNVNVPAGTTSLIVRVPTTNDVIAEGNENITLAASTAQNVAPVTGIGTITDSIDTTTVSLSATPSVAEGGSIVYTATLTSAAGSPLTVNLSGGQVITIAAGATIGTVSVAAPTDDVYIDAGTVSKTITSATGGSFENLVVNTAPATTNITDTLDVTTVSIGGSSSITEGGTGSYTVSLNNPAQTDVTVNLTYSGTAADGSDYTGVATVTILAGQSTANFNLVSTDDNIAEGAENITVTIGSATGGNFESLVVSGANGAVTTTITDNDLPPTITAVEPGAPGVGDDAVPEGTNLVYNVTLSNPSSTPVTYNFTLGGGLSTAGAGDIGAPVFSAGVTNNGDGTITVAPGVTGFSVTVPTTQDTIDEFDETVELTVGGVTGTGTITDDDAAPTISITGPATIDEAAGTATYTVTLSSPSGKIVTVDYSTSNGTATAGSDYTDTNGTLTFNPGTTTLTFTVPISEDLITEASEDFTVSLVAPTNATIATGSVTTNIIDNEGIPTIANIVGDTQTEGTALTYTVTLSNPSATPVTYAFTVGGGTSTASATDIGTPTFGTGVTDNGDGTITVAPGVTGFTVTVPSTQDLVAESNETVELTIGTATGTGTIVDDDSAPQISITGPGSVNEAAGTITYTVSLTNPSASTVTVNYASANGSATAGSDYTAATGTLSFAPGETTKTITVAITDDTVFEGPEDYSLNLSAPTNATIGTGSVTTTITDNDLPPTITAVEPGAPGVGDDAVPEGTNLVYNVTLSNPSSTPVTYNFTLGGGLSTAGAGDIGAPVFSAGVTNNGDGTITVAPGVTGFSVTVPTTQDTIDEFDETVELTVGGVTGTGTITDDDAAPTISITGPATIDEAAGTATYTVTLSSPSGKIVTVDYSTSNGTATAGSDYTDTNGTLTFNPGTTTLTFTVPISEDLITEASEDFTVSLVAPTNATIATGSVTTNIIDNDVVPIAVGNNNTGLEDATYIVVTLNGTDADGTVASFNLSSLPTNGALYLDAALTQLVPTGTDISASGNALQLYFKPEADFNTLAGGPLSFNFTAKDDTGLVSSTATETITVTAVNDGAPVTVADNYSTVLGTPIIISKASLLSNDTLFDHAQITSVTALSGTGTLVDNGNGTYTYTPAATGSRTFSYTVTDDDGQTSTSTVTLTTYNTRDDLATVNESALAEGNGGGVRVITGNLLANDAGNTSVTSLTGATLSGGVYTVSSAYGTLQVTAATGAYTYTLNNNVDNDTQSVATNTGYMDTFTYTGNSTGNGTPINLRVNIVDDAPTATNATVVVAEASLQAFNIVMMLDVSGSMSEASNGGQVRDVADDGSATITTRLAMAKAGMIALVEEYFSQSSSVTITLATFSTASQINGTYTSKDAAITAINGLTGSGGTNYEAALNTIKTAFGTPSQSVSNISYFISDGAPNGGNTTDPVGASGFGTFVTNNHIQSYAIGIGSGIATTAPLNAIHNVDADGSGAADAAIIVADLNKLETALISTVPHAFGGNVVTSGGASNVTFGADGGFIRYIDLMLDSDGNGTADQSVRFTYNATTHQITTNGSFVTGFPVSGDSMTLGAAQGFVNGKLVFDFSTGDYKYFTEGQGVEGTQFDIGFQVMDNDGDTANAVQTVMVVDGKPVAYNDFDTLLPNSTSFEGNVITSAGTDGSTGALVTSFTAASSGADLIVDNAAITSITFKGVVYNLTANSSGTASGGTYTISNGHLTWTNSTEPANQLVFDKDGYYKYTPPAVQTATATPDAAVTTFFNTSANATANGVVLSGVSRTGNVNSPNATLTYNDPNGTANDGVGINGGGSNANADNLETLIIRFNSATHPQGVQNVVVNVSAASSNLGSASGTVISLTYSVYDISGNLLGQFASFAEGNVVIPSIYGNIGYIEVEANSAASARISSVTFNSSNVNTTAIGYAPEDISYTLTDSDGDASTATLKLSTTTNHYAGGAAADNITGSAANDYITGGAGNDTLNGGAGYDIIIGGAGNDSIDGGADNDQLYGGDGNDTINGGTGNDLIYGGAGNDIINGGDGADTIYGGAGNDIINGGAGADTIFGGAGNDTLTGGGVGVDVFKWELTDQGAKGAPAADVITDFNAASVAAGGDVLDLRDLLVGENHDVGAGNLASFLHFEKSGADTIIHISSNGEFAAGFNAGKEVQTITLTGVDLVGSFTNDQQIVQDLLSKQKLVTD